MKAVPDAPCLHRILYCLQEKQAGRVLLLDKKLIAYNLFKEFFLAHKSRVKILCSQRWAIIASSLASHTCTFGAMDDHRKNMLYSTSVRRK